MATGRVEVLYKVEEEGVVRCKVVEEGVVRYKVVEMVAEVIE